MTKYLVRIAYRGDENNTVYAYYKQKYTSYAKAYQRVAEYNKKKSNRGHASVIED